MCVATRGSRGSTATRRRRAWRRSSRRSVGHGSGVLRRAARASRRRGVVRVRVGAAGVGAAVELQRRLRTPSGNDGRVFPVGVGVGLDAGEAVATEGGYRGGALNLAARLCSVAAPGQVLASESVVHLSQRVDGVQFSAARTRRFKGIDTPVRLVEVIPETPLPDIPVAAVAQRPRHQGLKKAPATARCRPGFSPTTCRGSPRTKKSPPSPTWSADWNRPGRSCSTCSRAARM